MSQNLFSGIDLLSSGLNAAWLKNDVISNNIANVDTPNFKASSVNFESALKTAANGSTSSGVTGKRTDSRHIKISSSHSSNATISKKPGTVRMDGNNVNIDAEMADLAKNTIYYNYLIQKTSKDFSNLKLAISEGR